MPSGKDTCVVSSECVLDRVHNAPMQGAYRTLKVVFHDFPGPLMYVIQDFPGLTTESAQPRDHNALSLEQQMNFNTPLLKTMNNTCGT